MTWHNRLTQAREAKGIKKSAFATLVGVKPSSVTDWENGDTKMIVGANLMRVCSVLEISPDWLIDGIGDMEGAASPSIPGAMPVVISDENDDNFYHIPLVKFRISAGVTGFQTEPDGNDETFVVSKAWARNKGFHYELLVAIRVKGQSMEPTLYEGDIVVINTGDRKMVDNAVFAMNYDGESVVKRMSRDAGEWWLMSDNVDQKRYYRRMCRNSECIVIGRVVKRESEQF